MRVTRAVPVPVACRCRRCTASHRRENRVHTIEVAVNVKAVRRERIRDVRICQVKERDARTVRDALRSRAVEVERACAGIQRCRRATGIQNKVALNINRAGVAVERAAHDWSRTDRQVTAHVHRAVVHIEGAARDHDVCGRERTAGVVGPRAAGVDLDIAADGGVRAVDVNRS